MRTRVGRWLARRVAAWRPAGDLSHLHRDDHPIPLEVDEPGSRTPHDDAPHPAAGEAGRGSRSSG